MNKKESKIKIIQDCRGFSLLEVLLGISVFMIGMLGVTALNISSLKSNTFSGNLSEATLLASAKLEEMMATEFDSIEDGPDGDGTNQDTNDDGLDNNGGNFGLDDTGIEADGREEGVGKNEIYNVYWNVAENEPVSVDPPRMNTINVIVQWSIKGEIRQISMSTVRIKEE